MDARESRAQLDQGRSQASDMNARACTGCTKTADATHPPAPSGLTKHSWGENHIHINGVIIYKAP